MEHRFSVSTHFFTYRCIDYKLISGGVRYPLLPTRLISFKTWCIQQGSKVPQLKYWQKVYDMEMLLLRFVRSIRTGDLFLYEKSWDEIADWAFILDHYNYAHWLPVQVRDTMNVRVKHPYLHRQFADGFVTIAKTQNHFSMIGFDQNHEQQDNELKM